MSKSGWAKLAGWIGGLLLAGAQGLGKYSALAQALGALLVSFGVHQASNTGGA